MDQLTEALRTGDMGAVFDALPASHRWVIGMRSHGGAVLLSVALVGRVVVTMTHDGWISAHSCEGATDADALACAEGKVMVGLVAGGDILTGPPISVGPVDEPTDAEIQAELARLLGTL